ncbi:CBM96 family carbohydrate-binding protein [Shewanella gaetbuli]
MRINRLALATLLLYVGASSAADSYDNSQSYQTGDRVIYQGKLYQAQWWAGPNQAPDEDVQNSWDSPWVLVEEESSQVSPPSQEYQSYIEGQYYIGGDIVSNDGQLYQCKEGATEGWCSGGAVAYEPGKGSHWQQAWVEVVVESEPEYTRDFVIEPSHDSYVYNRYGYRDNNYNDANVAPVVGNRHALVQFELDTSLAADSIESVHLMLFFSMNNSNSKVYIHQTSSDWDEATVTWNTRPEPGEQINIEIAPDGYKYIDVTEYIQSSIKQGSSSFYLRGENSRWESILVNNDNRKPKLIFRTKLDEEPEQPAIWQDYVNGNTSGNEYQLYDWSNAGYKGGLALSESPQLEFHVADFGALPNDGQDDTDAINAAIKAAGEAGGGIVRFDKGQYDININEQDEFKLINVAYSNVFLKGADSELSTVLKQWKPIKQDSSLHRYVRTPHTINFGLGTEAPLGNILITEAADALTQILTLKSLKPSFGDLLSEGDPIEVVMYSNGTSDLTNSLIAPRTTTSKAYDPYILRTRVKRIIDEQHIEIANPLSAPLDLKFTPRVLNSPRLTQNVGVEDIKIITASNESYCHHCGELGYGWGGIAMYNVMDGYIRNVHIDNAVQDITIISSSNVSAFDVVMTDDKSNGGDGYVPGGHSGIGFIDSDFNLVKNVKVHVPKTHLIQYNGVSIGNVVTEVENLAATRGTVDHHGLGFGHRNLIENSFNLQGDNAGSGGQFNVFWNVQTEMFSGGLNFFKMNHDRMPKSIFVGLRSPLLPKQLATVDSHFSDNQNEWYYLEVMNSSELMIPSVYEAQSELNYVRGVRN